MSKATCLDTKYLTINIVSTGKYPCIRYFLGVLAHTAALTKAGESGLKIDYTLLTLPKSV